MESFEKEQGRVVLLMQRLGIVPGEYLDPNTTRAGETGADVTAIIDGRRIGIQVTDIDTGEVPGIARAAETKLNRDAAARGSTYGNVGAERSREGHGLHCPQSHSKGADVIRWF